MSNFRTLSAKQLTDQALLIEALRKLGYKPVVEPGQTVRGDRSYDNRGGYDVLLKLEDTKLAGDIGFRKEQDGSFSIGMDQYIIRTFSPESLVQKVTGEYLEAKARKAMRGQSTELMTAREVTINGRQVTRLVYRQVAA